MKKGLQNVLLTLLVLAMLLGVAVSVPLGSITEQAQADYLNAGPADADDEYAFLFDD